MLWEELFILEVSQFEEEFIFVEDLEFLLELLFADCSLR